MGRFIFLSFGLLVGFLSLSGTAFDCPCDWSSYKGHCYRVFQQQVNWEDAERLCTLQQTCSHLVSFHSREEADFVVSLTFPILKYDSVWIGLSNIWERCRLEWSDGTDLSYKGWGSEPECVVSGTAHNQWWIIPCTKVAYFVCKFQA